MVFSDKNVSMYYLLLYNYPQHNSITIATYYILCWRIKGFDSAITAIGSYIELLELWCGSYRTLKVVQAMHNTIYTERGCIYNIKNKASSTLYHSKW